MDKKTMEWIADTLANSEDSEREIVAYLSRSGKVDKDDAEKLVKAWFKMPSNRGMMSTAKIIDFIEKTVSQKFGSDNERVAKQLVRLAKILIGESDEL